jgi:hypothetical protein
LANLVTLATLEANALSRCDAVTDPNIVTAELLGLINYAYGRFYDLLIASNENYKLSSFAFTTVAGQSTYPLASDHHITKGVDAQLQNSAQPVTVNRFEFSERNKYGIVPLPAAGVSPVSAGFEYEEQGTNIVFIPGKVMAAIPITVWYYPVPVQLVNTTDTVDVVGLGWDEYISLLAASKVLIKQESDAGQVLMELAALEKEIKARSSRRNQTQGHHMVSSLKGIGRHYRIR